jgi:glycosyltransferase involved in cell wall biosynthesis
MSDVCLVLEGTYPYITGGVSTCVHQLISETPNTTYHIIHIGANKSQSEEYKYKVPKNVEKIQNVYLYDYEIPDEEIDLKAKLDLDLLHDFHSNIVENDPNIFFKLYTNFIEEQGINPLDLLRSKQAWQYLQKQYNTRFDYNNAPSFIDYFYTWRFTHYPIFKLLNVNVPTARVYHSFCTGYAGFLASVAKYKNNSSLILSEHGIYTREREIEIFQSDWIYVGKKSIHAKREMSFFRSWWTKLFKFMSMLTYTNADYITTLYSGNRDLQLKYGAKKEKIKIIPNGIDISSYKLANKPNNENTDNKIKNVSLVGRVVPIKDIKTFIKAMAQIVEKNPNYHFYIIGPTEEDEEYFHECLQLVEFYELESYVTFTGKVLMDEYYQKTDLLVLSSISEGQPMVILEGFAYKIPTVATDVGSCKELIYGDSELGDFEGDAGAVVPLGQDGKLAEKIRFICEDETRLKEFGENGFQRVSKYYREKDNILEYNKIYEELKYRAV